MALVRTTTAPMTGKLTAGLGYGFRTLGETDPRSIPNLRLWLDGTRVSGVSAGSPVSNWPDLSGHENDATQGTADNQPTLTANGVDFDGTNDTLQAGTLGDAGSKSQRGLTLWAVVRIDTTDPVCLGGLLFGQNSGVYVAVNWNPDATAQTGGFRVWAKGSDLSNVLIGGPAYDTGVSDGEFHVVGVQVVPGTQTVRVQIDGNEETITYESQQALTMTDFVNQWVVGARNRQPDSGDVDLHLDGAVKEYAIYSGHDLSDLEMARLNRYGAQRHGVSLA